LIEEGYPRLYKLVVGLVLPESGSKIILFAHVENVSVFIVKGVDP
jgi:hypothetical protein